MCGIVGVVTLQPNDWADEALLQRMCRLMRHRGPDDEGYYMDAHASLGMRRLQIIDLVTGQQPATNETGTLWLVFNGEIYNYRALRCQLEKKGHIFRSHSDTEVIVHAYEEYGDRCVEQFNGMFAFALWDSPRHRLFLARDRLGIKPLYYWCDGQQLIFGSELKALLAHPAVPRSIDLAALDHFLTLEYIPAPHTILSQVKKLPAGHQLVFAQATCTIQSYWDVPVQPTPRHEVECIEALTDLIDDAVRLQLVSDVPLGAFLSGGIDSSTVVAAMSRSSSLPVQTFSIGFDDQTYNELPYARAVARHFATAHHEAILQPDVATLAERLIRHLDEPLGDFSILPTYLVAEMARRQVTVVLSGDGGDELFGGYESYVAQRFARFYDRLPAALRQQLLPSVMGHVPPQSAKKGLINKAKRFVEGGALPPALQHTRWMTFLPEADKAVLYQPHVQRAIGDDGPLTLMMGHFRKFEGADALAQQQYVDIKTYLVDNILTKVDRMSMAASLEVRVPLLDHRIVEFALNLPPQMKIGGGQTKRILRKAMANRLPATILNKPKQGFSIPLKHWLCGPLRPMMMDLLAEERIKQRGYFQPACIAHWITEHTTGRVNHSHRLWALMVFELWQQQSLP